MRLVPREMDKLLLHYAGSVAEERLSKNIKLNYPEAVAYISKKLLEYGREGKTVAELMQLGRKLLQAEQVMDGVASMIHEVQVEITFPDGTKLVTVHDPIPYETGSTHIPGEFFLEDEEICLNVGKKTVEISVSNTADRPVQVGSHFHFFEINRKLRFDRKAAYGMRLDIPAGTAVRFEPGEKKTVMLTEIGGARKCVGLNGLVSGKLDDEAVKKRAFERAEEQGFFGMDSF